MRALALVLAVLAACTAPVDLSVQAPATLASEPSGHELARVERAIDGDTLEVVILKRVEGPGAGQALPGERWNVRLVAIDTPESVHPSRPVECFGKQAARAAEVLLRGRRVRLVRDVEDVDGYRRLLRYVYMGAEMANARLVVNGYAHAYTYPPNVRHADLFVQLQRDAREENRGLWAPDTCNGDR